MATLDPITGMASSNTLDPKTGMYVSDPITSSTPTKPAQPVTQTPVTQSSQSQAVYAPTSGTSGTTGALSGYQTPQGFVSPTGAPTTPTTQQQSTAYGQAQQNITPGATPKPQDFFSQVQAQMQPVLDQINQATIAAEQAATMGAARVSTQQTGALNYGANMRGLAGSSEGNIGAANIESQRANTVADAVAQAEQAKATAVQNLYKNISTQASSDFQNALQRSDAQSQAYVAQKQKDIMSSFASFAQHGITSGTDLAQTNPQAYQQALQYFNNDPAQLDQAMFMAQPQTNIAQSWTDGTKAYQLIVDPTGKTKPRVQSTDLGINIPNTWTSEKIGTNSLIQRDPSNPMNSVMYSTNPFTGQTEVVGTGTGKALADAYNKTHGDTSTQTETPSPQAQSVITATTTAMGVPTEELNTPTSQVVASHGMAAIVAGLIHQEGGSPQGVQNNPGNIKFAGLPGQVDSGVKATDGGTFASYPTREDGIKAVGDLVTKAGNKPLSQFIASYKGVASPSAGGKSTADPKQYGLLATKTDFNPTNDVDKMASSYIKNYIANGRTPTAASLGLSTRTGAGAILNTIQERANELATQATGGPLPDPQILTNNKKIINTNNQLLNKQALQAEIVKKNFDLVISGMKKDGVNTEAKVVNDLSNWANTAIGDPATAAYMASNGTLSTELAALLAVKNASGTTVQDKLEAAGIIPKGTPIDAQIAIVERLEKEAMNIKDTINQQNKALYPQVDPFAMDTNNPMHQQIQDQPIVEQALSSKGINYDEFVSQSPEGSIPVLDRTTQQPGFIPVEEFNASKYIKI